MKKKLCSLAVFTVLMIGVGIQANAATTSWIGMGSYGTSGMYDLYGHSHRAQVSGKNNMVIYNVIKWSPDRVLSHAYTNVNSGYSGYFSTKSSNRLAYMKNASTGYIQGRFTH